MALAAFEKAFADYRGTAHCVSLANGTDALELALRALRVRAGGIVATVANASMYSTTAILALRREQDLPSLMLTHIACSSISINWKSALPRSIAMR